MAEVRVRNRGSKGEPWVLRPRGQFPFRFSGVLSGKPVHINTKIPCFQHYIQFFGVLITVICFLRVIIVYNLAVRCTRLKYLSSNKYKQ